MEAKTQHSDVWRKRGSKIFGECFGIELQRKERENCPEKASKTPKFVPIEI